MKTPWTAASLLFVGLFLPATTALAQSSTGPNDGLALQIALEKSGFSAGILDGHPGGKAGVALREFQAAHGLPVTGQADSATWQALGVDPSAALTTYTVRGGDLDQVGAVPRKWTEKAKLSRLPYPSLDQMLAEKFHCTRALLSSLNGGKNLAGLDEGDQIVVPNVPAMPRFEGVTKIEVNLSLKQIRLFGADGSLRGLLHCSVAAHTHDLPHGQTRVAVITNNPTYVFNPAKWPEVKNVTQKLTIPPGPHNPVGLCWMGLALRGYGIHGTPTPENIGKTGSHGCIRLANWDATRLGRSIAVGTTVVFVGGPQSNAVASR
jgi:hypothetical protein